MLSGKDFEYLIKNILLNAGFNEINSDELYIFDSPAGQMLQGLGQAHNTDVLVEPPFQIPFYFPTRLIVECKNHTKQAGLNIVRSALGLREDVNSFNIIDINVLKERKISRRTMSTYNFDRYHYQVAVASMNGFTLPAQEFALAHQIPLITFTKMPFWNQLIASANRYNHESLLDNTEFKNIVNELSHRMAVAITKKGQLLFLYNESDYGRNEFNRDEFTLHWQNKNSYWTLICGNNRYIFELPKKIKESWLKNSLNSEELKLNALKYKREDLSSLMVYYLEYGMARVKALVINKNKLEEAYKELRGNS